MIVGIDFVIPALLVWQEVHAEAEARVGRALYESGWPIRRTLPLRRGRLSLCWRATAVYGIDDNPCNQRHRQGRQKQAAKNRHGECFLVPVG